MIEALIAVTVIMATAIYTPGPNTLFALAAGSRGGFVSALPTVFWITIGCIALLALGWGGAAALFESAPQLRTVLAVAGSGYLIWMGARMIWPKQSEGAAATPARFSIDALAKNGYGLAIFQLLNPKAWVLVLTIVSVLSGQMDGIAGFLALTSLYVSMSVTSLMLWAFTGSVIGRRMNQSGDSEASSLWLNRVLGSALVASAGFIIVGAF